MADILVRINFLEWKDKSTILLVCLYYIKSKDEDLCSWHQFCKITYFFLNIYFKLRFGLVNAIKNYSWLRICVVWRKFLTLNAYQLNLPYKSKSEIFLDIKNFCIQKFLLILTMNESCQILLIYQIP